MLIWYLCCQLFRRVAAALPGMESPENKKIDSILYLIIPSCDISRYKLTLSCEWNLVCYSVKRTKSFISNPNKLLTFLETWVITSNMKRVTIHCNKILPECKPDPLTHLTTINYSGLQKKYLAWKVAAFL